MSLAILAMLLTGSALWSTPFWFRKDIQFGVTLTDSMPPETVRSVRRTWLWAEGIALLGSAVGISLWLALEARGAEWAQVQLLYIVFTLAAWAAGWAWAHRRLLLVRNRAAVVPPGRDRPREATLRARRFGEHYSLGAALSAGLILVLWCGWLAYVYPELPARIATHFDASGHPNGWMTRSFESVFLVLPGMGVILWIVIDLLAYLILHSRIVAHSGSAGEAEHAYRHAVLQFVQWMKPVIILFMAWIQVATLLPQVSGRPAVLEPAEAFLPGLILFAYIVGGIIWMGRARLRETGSASAGGDMSSDEHWVFGGLFYYNPADPALLVEKRMGLGYTFNMAQPLAWLFLLLIVGLALLPIFLAKVHR